MSARAEESGKIVILHTNDVHCNADQVTDASGAITNIGYAAVAAYKKAMQSEYGNGNVTLVDAGDHIQGTSIGMISKGENIIDIMNQVGYDIAIPGNHEFDYGFSRFLELTKKADFPYLCCNLTKLSDGTPVLDPYKMVTYGKTKVAYVGIATPESIIKSTPTYFQDGNGNYIYSFAEDATGQKLYDTVQNTVNAARSAGADYVVAIGHLGEKGITDCWKSSAVIANTNGIDILLDGHSHEKIEDQLKNRDGKNVVRAQTGTQLETIGKIVIDPSTGEISQELVSGYGEQDASVLSYIRSVETALKAELNITVGTAEQALITKDPATGSRLIRNGETNLGDLCADAYRTVLGTDIGFMNGGGIRADLAAGNITKEDVLNVYPFENVCCIVKVKGQQLLDALEFSARNYPEENGGFLQVSGMSYSIDPSVKSSVVVTEKQEFAGVEGARRVHDVSVNGQPLDVNKDYTVGGIRYMLIDSGDGYSMFHKEGTIVKDGVIGDYDCLTKYIQSDLSGTIGAGYENPAGQGRIKIAPQENAAGQESGLTVSTLPIVKAYTVQSRDTLWKIAKKTYGDGNLWTVIYNANRDTISNPDRIEVGQDLILPAA